MLTRSTPYSEGDPAAKILFVAEAPARYEMIDGKPLVGPSGKVFNECLHKAGITRHQVSIANVCREPISSTAPYIDKNNRLTERGREQTEDLYSRLRNHTPNVIVPLGALATACFTDRIGPKVGITKLRGSILGTSKEVQALAKKCIPALHPASTLPGRGPFVNIYTITSDIRKAVAQSGFREYSPPQRKLQIWPKLEEIRDFLEYCRECRRFAYDIEIHNLQVSCISFAPSPWLSMSIPFSGDIWDAETEAYIWKLIAELFSDKNCVAIAQYGMFDVSFLLLQNKIRIRCKPEDTYIKQRVCYPDFPASLEFMCSTYTEEPYYKDDRKMWNRIQEDPGTFYTYNARDSAVTIECDDVLEGQELDKHPNLRYVYENTMSHFEACLYMMARGVRLNQKKLKDTQEQVRDELAAKEAELNEVAEVPFNANSPKQCIQYFYGIKGIKPYVNRKTGKPTCDDTALTRIFRRTHLVEAKVCQEIRALAKLKGTYLDLQFDPDGYLRCFYNPRGTTTGRLSSSKTVFERGLNMQNLHPRFKYFIVPDSSDE